MGLLIKRPIKRFLQFHKDGDPAGYVRLDEPPFIIGKLVKIQDENEAVDFKSRQLQYYIGQVPGYKIFFVHAGFYEVPDRIISDEEIKTHIDDMCMWYKETIVPEYKSIQRKYKL